MITFCYVELCISVVMYLNKQFSDAWTISLIFCAENTLYGDQSSFPVIHKVVNLVNFVLLHSEE